MISITSVLINVVCPPHAVVGTARHAIKVLEKHHENFCTMFARIFKTLWLPSLMKKNYEEARTDGNLTYAH
jgi:hypothetical protein